MSTEWKMVPDAPTYAAKARLAVTKEWARGWDDCLAYALAASPQPAAQPEREALAAIMRYADQCKEQCSMDSESQQAIRNGKFASIAQMAAQGLGLIRGPSFAQPEQPEPGVLTEAQALAIADKHGTRWAAPDEEGISFEKSAFFDFLSEVLATTRKRTAEQNARIMEAVRRLAVLSSDFAEGECTGSAVDAAFAEVERLLRGEA